MDWRSVRFDWNHARSFLVAAEEGSFSAAGRVLNIAQPTIGRQVAALEEELAVVLFEGVGNAIKPTSAGLDLIVGPAGTQTSSAVALENAELRQRDGVRGFCG